SSRSAPHARSRNAARVSGSRSIASATTDFTTRQRSVFTTSASEIRSQPRAGDRPIALDRALRHAEYLGRLFHAQPAEESQLDDLLLPRIQLLEARERFVEIHQLLRPLVREQHGLFERHALRIRAAPRRAPLARVIDE